MALRDLTKEAVELAIAEFDKLGRAAFLQKYGYKEARGYLLQDSGSLYDSKAIAGAAHGFLPGREPLRANEFSGGAATVQRTLNRLGFRVHSDGPSSLPEQGQVLTNEQIAVRFGVGKMGEMRRSRAGNLLVLISDPYKGLYMDRWEGDTLHYTGMGKTGPQSLDFAQNRTLRDSTHNGVAVHLLEAFERREYLYRGRVSLSGEPYQETQFDKNGDERLVWMFPLRLEAGASDTPITPDQARAIEAAQSEIAQRLTNGELERRALRSSGKPPQRNAQTTVFVRDAAVAEYVKRLAKGLCDLCRQPAPFKHKQVPYLECHHITWLSCGGIDAVANAVALCPNCHRRMHVLDYAKDREILRVRVTQRGALG